jgi:hypothetical protein
MNGSGLTLTSHPVALRQSILLLSYSSPSGSISCSGLNRFERQRLSPTPATDDIIVWLQSLGLAKWGLPDQCRWIEK